MPWDASSFHRHNASLTPAQSGHAARIANAIVRGGAGEGIAIATANKMAKRATGGILGGGIGSVSTPMLQNVTAAPPGGGASLPGIAQATTALAQRGVPTGQVAQNYDAGGSVDPNQGVAAALPTDATFSPISRGLAQQYATLPTEKLAELQAMLGNSPRGQVIRSVLAQRRTQPPAQAQARGGVTRAGAGIAVQTSQGEILFLKRAHGSDHPGTWCIPGGRIEGSESPDQAARREFAEETGHRVGGKLVRLDEGRNGFVTYGASIPKRFVPKGDGEHTQYCWARPDKPPRPLHPGVADTIAKLVTPRRDFGGGLGMSLMDPSWERQDWRQASQPARGFLGGSTFGRADSIKTEAPAGSYIVPADVVAGVGEGNNLAGARLVDAMLHSEPYGIQGSRQVRGAGPPRPPSLRLATEREAKGGAVRRGASAVPVLLSDGEMAIHPDDLRTSPWIGAGGDLKKAHRIMDEWVVHERQKHIKTLKKLPGPVKADRAA